MKKPAVGRPKTVLPRVKLSVHVKPTTAQALRERALRNNRTAASELDEIIEVLERKENKS
jgi:hypothetical protein